MPLDCASAGADCGSLPDGCGATLNCGSCASGEVCGASAPNTCGPGSTCTPLSCADIGASCGSVGDGCGGILSCGNCATGETCTNNVCVAPPQPTTTVSFANDVDPIFAAQCTSCHSSGAGGYTLRGIPSSDYAPTAARVDLANPANSLVLQKATGRSHPFAVFAVGSAQYNTILTWVQEGALDN